MTLSTLRPWLLALVACLVLAGCAGTGYPVVHDDGNGPVHGESGGGAGGGGSM